MITNFYVDAFNLYYGCLRGSPYKWLDLQAFCQNSFPADTVNKIRYCTARISGRPSDPKQPMRQNSYLRALSTLPCVTIHFGHFLTKKVLMTLAAPKPGGPTKVEVMKTEEKGSDVNLATVLLVDAFRNDFEQAVVISNDSDLAYPIEIVRKDFKLPVVALLPCSNKR